LFNRGANRANFAKRGGILAGFCFADHHQQTRRTILAGAAAFGAVALSGVSNAASNAQRRIDVHHHCSPQVYEDFMKAHGQATGMRLGGGPGGAAFPRWNLASDLEDMDKSGTQLAILSMTTPGFWFGARDEVRKVMRSCNEFMATLKSDHKGRFCSFAAIPMNDVDGALSEIAYAYDVLKTEGIGVFSNYGDKWLGDASFDPIYDELNLRKSVVFVHPLEAKCCLNIVPEVADTIVEFGADTTRAIASLIFTGSAQRHPDITWIFSHGGGMMPYLIERFLPGTTTEIVPGIPTKGQGKVVPPNVPNGALAQLRRMYFDTAQCANPVAMRALKEVAGPSQILFGTDFWYRTAAETGANLDASRVFSPAELAAINRGNAIRILPSLAASHG
jgi:predicted TIM-barrel fold metal-dependent hydrolase